MALLPPFFLDCVVAIGVEREGSEPRWVASGFLYGDLREVIDDQKSYIVYLVSNRHVFDGLSKALVRFNPLSNEPAKAYELDLMSNDGAPHWTAHPDPNIDVGIIPINYQLLDQDKMKAKVFQSDNHCADVKKLKEIGITEGDGAYILGFPMGLVGEQRNSVLVRGGTIARIGDLLDGSSMELLVDSFIFPGNSGGPVVSRPESTHITGTKAQDKAYLIGVVKSYIPYRETAVSSQTGNPRVIFEENSGLAGAHPVDCIRATIEHRIAKVASQNAPSELVTPTPADAVATDGNNDG